MSMTTFDGNEFSVIRTAIAGRFNRPAIAVVSATPNDGTAFVANGLALSFARCSYKTALVLVDGHATTIGKRTSSAASVMAHLETIVRPDDAASDARAFARFITECREKFDVVIMTSKSSGLSDAMLQAATLADGMVIAVQDGRVYDKRDRQLQRSLQFIETPVIGVVPVGRKALQYEISVPPVRIQTISGEIRPQPIQLQGN